MAKEMLVEKSIIIDKPLAQVFDYLRYTMNQNDFSVWNMKDPGKKTEVSGVDGTVGFIYSWDSKDKTVGAGSQEITSITEGKSITYKLAFERPMKNVAQSGFYLRDLGNEQTEVKWEFRGPTKFPMSLFKGFLQNMLGKDMDKSLTNLKNVLDK
jgi:uncharacterized protein YndB with AHSA1/START domain